jgi:hypothetical protein
MYGRRGEKYESKYFLLMNKSIVAERKRLIYFVKHLFNLEILMLSLSHMI